MRIKAFNIFIQEELMEPRVLKDCPVIVDGTNLAHRLFKESNLSHNFGCECDKLTKFVREYLIMFKRAKVRCYLIFKGGDSVYKEKIQNNKFAMDYTVLLYESFRQALEEMDIDYTICEFAAKMECVAAAQKLNCPLISFDVEYCFSNVAYIPLNTLKYNEFNECIDCMVYKLENLCKKFQVTKEKLSLMIALKDVTIFPENTFDIFFAFMRLRAPYNYPKVYFHLLQWLSKTTFNEAVNQIFKWDFKYKNVTRETFLEELQRINNFIGRTIQGGIPVQYLNNENNSHIVIRDIDWFKKGVASKHIAVPYINLYHSKIIRGFTFTASEEIDPKLFSIDIIKYAYDLLTDFQQESFKGFTLIKFFDELIKPTAVEEKILEEVKSVGKPRYDAVASVFENGWQTVEGRHLFNHFLTETVQLDFEHLASIPDEIKLFYISLVYYSRKKGEQCEKKTENLVISVILSHVILNNVLDEKSDFITQEDRDIATEMMEKYFTEFNTLDTKLQYSLYEYAICLEEFNYLNNLCGTPYMNTKYGNVFNGTFIYNIYHAIEHENDQRAINALHDILKPCPTVFTYFKILVDNYRAFVK